MKSIKEFVENYKAKNFMNTPQGAQERVEWIRKELDTKEYIPFDEKQAIAQTVLISCSSISDGVIVIDSIRKYMIFTMAMLSTYTNLESDEDISLSDAYDALCSCQVGDGTMLDAIIKTFEIEYSRCNDILNMMTADLLAENNIEKQVGKFLSNLSEKVNELGDGLIDKLGDFNMDLSQLDIDKLTSMIDKIK
jgi:hypothetical protein